MFIMLEEMNKWGNKYNFKNIIEKILDNLRNLVYSTDTKTLLQDGLEKVVH